MPYIIYISLTTVIIMLGLCAAYYYNLNKKLKVMLNTEDNKQPCNRCKYNVITWLPIYDKLGIPVHVVDAETYEILYINDVFKNLAGDVVGQPCYKVLYGYSEPCAFCSDINSLKKNGDFVAVKSRYNPKSKNHLNILESLVDWEQNRKARLCLSVEITELAERIPKIYGKPSLFSIHEAIINSLNIGLFSINSKCKILFVNDFYQSLVGRELRVGERLPVEELYIQEDANHFLNKSLPSVLNGKTENREVILKNKDGLEIPLLIASFPVRDENGNIFAYASTGIDITEQKKRDAAIERHLHSQEFLSTFTIPFTQPNNIDELINNAMSELQKYLHADRICVYLYRDDDSFISASNEPSASLLACEDSVGILERMPRGSAACCGYLTCTYEMQTKPEFGGRLGNVITIESIRPLHEKLIKGTYVYYSDTRELYNQNPGINVGAKSTLYVPLMVDGNCLGYMIYSTFEECTPWTDSECRLAAMAGSIVAGAIAVNKSDTALIEALKEAHKANAAKSQFLSNMSHEIRTPLNAIIGLAEILKQAATKKCPDMVKPIKELMSASDHLLDILNDVLDMAKIESGKFTLANQAFDILSAVENVKMMISQRCVENSIELIWDFNGLSNTVVLGDELRLKQILINLLGNAVKFTPKDGKIYFNIQVNEQNDDSVTITFTVKDTGIGMSEEQMSRLFRAFVQADNNTASQFGGTGLGLAISQSFASKMGSKINVQSTLNEGSVFYFTVTLELSEEQLQTDEIIEISNIDLTGKHILIAEDIEINRLIITELLKETNAQFDEAEDGAKTVKMFEQSPEGYYDLIFMDVQMPHMDGYKATRCIRDMVRTDARSVPIIAMTANAYKEDVDEALAAGMNGHLAKPIDISKIMLILKDK